MKHFIFLLLITVSATLTLNSCKSSEGPTKEECPNAFTYGATRICLPVIDSMNNYYPDTTIQRLAGKLELPSNSVQAFYITDEVYNGMKSTGLMVNDNFLKVFTINSLSDFKADSAYLEQVVASIKSNKPFYDWNEIRLKMEAGIDFITTGQDIYIEQYTPTPGVRSFVMLSKYINVSQPELLMGVLNIMLIRDKLIGMNYYKLYKGPETMDQARTKNDAIVRRFMDVNSGY